MAFDFSSAVSAAQKAVNPDSSKRSYTYPLVYPQPGSTITIRVLFNPKSGLIARSFWRHEKVACLKTYGKECPICKVQEDVKNSTGMDPFNRTSSAKSRGILFAQFINSTVPIKKGNDGFINPGDIVLFMHPYTVYNQINQIIQVTAQSPSGMESAFSKASTGLFVQINVTPDFKYTTTPIPYMTYDNGMTDEQFGVMLENMESLNDQVIPAQFDESVNKEVQEYANEIYKQYIAPKVAPTIPQPNTAVPQNFMNIPNTATVPNNTTAIPNVPNTTGNFQ